MPIIGINLNSVNAKRNPETVSGEISINSTPRITSMKETELKPLDKKVLKIGFEFLTSYKEVGEIKLNGDMLFMHEKHDDILKHWEKAKMLQQDIAVEVFNALFAKCLLKSSMLAEELQLPLPMNLPRVKPGADAGAPVPAAPQEEKKEEGKESEKKKK